MLSTHDDISVLKAYCKLEGEHDRAEHDDHINLSVPNEVPVLSAVPLLSGKKATSTKPSYKVPRIPPRRLALCGGGVRGVGHVGVMKALKEAGLLSCVKEMIGVSAGSLVCLLWVLGYSLEETERLALEFDFKILGKIEPESAFMFPITFGLDSGENLERLIVSILRQKGFEADATFADLHKKCPITLRCYATELQTRKIREFGTFKSPQTPVRIAIRASMSLPILYTPVKDSHSEALLIDGGVLNNLPMVFLNEKEVNETWGVMFIMRPSETAKPVNSLTELFKFLWDGMTFMRSSIFIDRYKERVILIPTDEFSGINFEETKEARSRLIEKSRLATETFLWGMRTGQGRRFSAC